MEQVTQYVQKPVVTPYTQYRAVYSTRYVQMQPGATQSPGAVAVPGAAQVPGAVYAPGPVAGSQKKNNAKKTNHKKWQQEGKKDGI